MGIPRYYAEILKKYPEVVSAEGPKDIDHLLIDFNAMIYSCIPEILDIKDLIGDVIKKLLAMISITRPKKSIYIAMDGSVPMGKIIQQRSRRYKTLIEKLFIDD